MHKSIQLFFKSKRHLGNFGIAICINNNGQLSQPLLIEKSTVNDNVISSRVLLKVIAYLYKEYRNYSIDVISNRHNLVMVTQRLPYWRQANWKVMDKTSSDIYNEAKTSNKGVFYKYIPKNYKDNIPVYKRILKSKLFFPNGLSFDYMSSNYPAFSTLKQYLNNQIGYLPATQSFQHQRILNKSSKITIKLPPQRCQLFSVLCRKINHKSPQDFIKDSVNSYINMAVKKIRVKAKKQKARNHKILKSTENKKLDVSSQSESDTNTSSSSIVSNHNTKTKSSTNNPKTSNSKKTINKIK